MIKAINTIHTDHHATYELVLLGSSITVNIAVVILICIKLFFL